MDEYRAEQAKRWSQAKKDGQVPAPPEAPEVPEAPPAGGPAVEPEAPPSEVAAAVPEGTDPVRRVHILPVATTRVNADRIVEVVGPWLRHRRSSGLTVWKGLRFRVIPGDPTSEFVVVCAEPSAGVLTRDTQYFFDGAPVVIFRKVQYMAFNHDGAPEEDTAELFSRHLEPAVKRRMATREDISTVGLLQVNDSETTGGKTFVITATDPPGIGMLDKNTCVYVDWDDTPAFERVHCLAFSDTVPQAYEFDLFEDYLRPYFALNPTVVYRKNDTFKYRGIQFKVMCTDPEGIAGRVGKKTTIFCEGNLQPSIRDLLPPELAAQISRFPPGLQMLLLSSDVMGGDVYERLMEMQEMLQRNRGMTEDTIGAIPVVKYNATDYNDQSQCMVCLSDFEADEELYKLPCNHIFHKGCITEWLMRCTDCPLCKANVDRSIREY